VSTPQNDRKIKVMIISKQLCVQNNAFPFSQVNAKFLIITPTSIELTLFA